MHCNDVIFCNNYLYFSNNFLAYFNCASGQNNLNESRSRYQHLRSSIMRSYFSFRKGTMQINIVLYGGVRKAVIKWLFSDPQLFYTVSSICVFFCVCYTNINWYLCFLQWNRPFWIGSVLWLMQLLERYWSFCIARIEKRFSEFEEFQSFRSELLYISIKGRLFVLHETCCCSTEI